MSKIHPASDPALLPQLDLWTIPDSQQSILRDVEYEIRPVSTFSSSTPLRFEVRPALDEFMLFNESHIWLKLKITLSHPGKAIEGSDWANVTPVSNLMHSLFKHVSVAFNNREVTINPSNYSYKAYIENYLGFSDSAKKGRLSAIGWDEDPAVRRKFITDGVQDDPSVAIIDFEGMLNLDFTFQEKTVPGNVNVILELIPNLVSFYMKTEGDYKVSVDFQDAVWYVHKAVVKKETLDGIMDGFNNNHARYVLTRTEVRTTTIPANVFDYPLDNLVMGRLPRRMIIGFVTNNAFSGRSKDPFEFAHFNICQISASIDGTPYPLRPYQPDFKKNCFVREFRALYRALNQTGTDTHLTMSRSEFKKKPLFAFQFAPDLSNGGTFSSHVNLKKRGNLRVQLKFSERLNESIVAVAYCEYDSCIEITKFGEVLIDVNDVGY